MSFPVDFLIAKVEPGSQEVLSQKVRGYAQTLDPKFDSDPHATRDREARQQ